MVWNARLAIDYGTRDSRTRIARLSHRGPLTLQKAFYPDNSGMMHNYILHPPGGLVGGDRLDLELQLRDKAAVLLTTPAAGKIYRTPTEPSQFSLKATVADACELLWLPHENIVFEGARHQSELLWNVKPRARVIAWDIQCLGRPGSGFTFDHGRLFTQMKLEENSRLLLWERHDIAGGSALMDKPWGLAGCTAWGCMLFYGSNGQFTDQDCGDHSADGVEVGITRRESCLMVRARASCALRLKARFLEILHRFYSEHWGRTLAEPRIWAY